MIESPQYAEYPFLGLVFGVIVLPPDLQIVTTNMALAAALGVDPGALHSVYNRHPKEFNPVSVSNGHGKEFNSISLSVRQAKEIAEMIKRHRAAFMVRRVRDDLLLWTEEDIYMHCRYSESPRANEFMRHNVKFLRQWRMENVPLNGISPERFAKLEAENQDLRQRVEKIERLTPFEKTITTRFTVN